MNTELRQALDGVARRIRQIRLRGALAACWMAWALIGLGVARWLSWSGRIPAPGWIAAFVALAAGSGLVCAAWALRSARDRLGVARRIEATHPELATGLLAAVEVDAAPPAGRLGFLQEEVLRGVLDHRRVRDWDETVPSGRLRLATWAHHAALALLLVASVALLVQARSRAGGRPSEAARAAAAGLTVEPGDAEIERGTALLVVARFADKDTVPAEANLVVEGSGGLRRAMTRSLDDPTFAGRVEAVEADLTYRVEFADQSSRNYHVTVFEYPEVLRTDAGLVFPDYTALEPKTVEDIRHVTAVEGTELTLLCRLNKDVARAELVDGKNEPIALASDGGDGHVYRTTLTLADSRRFHVRLIDHEGRTNKLPADVLVNVTRNRPAVVTMGQPAHDVRVSPVEELTLKAKLEDDFGVVRHGVSYTLAGREPKEIVLDDPESRSRRLAAEHLLDFESFRAAPDELVTYYFWAEDIGPDGQPRRSSGDLYFAEVRPFEEIFRQGEQPPSGSAEGQQGGGNAQAAMQLAELQKQIINGTWTLLRREIGPKPSGKFAEDIATLVESQEAALVQAGQLGERLQDPTSKANLEQATKFMTDAERRLGETAGSQGTPDLAPALAAEQAAYQALLKLRDREFSVIRRNSRQRQGGSSAGGPSQRQLQQLELTEDEDRYEEQRSARAQQERMSQREQEQRETRQVLNRLRELARRQEDLNERLKELQSALEAAKDPQKREEIERQLKRLRDQQQQILRDTDGLRERMEREENRDRMADARQGVEQSREHARRASEALEEGRLSQALTEGTRAGRQLEELREEFRKEAANRFSEELTEMRDQARRLDERQDELTSGLDAASRRLPHALRDGEEGRQLRQGLEEQGQELDKLLDRMRETVQAAEEPEPLLAEELFNTVRKANEQLIPDALKAAQRLSELGVAEEAARASRHAGEGLDQLREGVERAARSVLGDETEALKRARGELDDLADQVNREIARASGDEPAGREGEPGRDRPGEAQGQQGDRAEPRESQGDAQGQPGQQGDRQGQRGGRGEPQEPQQGGGQDPRGGQDPQGQDRQQGGGQDPQGQGQQGEGGRRGAGPLRGNPGDQQQNQGGGGGNRAGGIDRLIDGLNRGGPGGPITGEGFREWSDRMRDVEELLDDPDLRAEAARIRDRVRGAREEFRRHAKEPDWSQLKTLVADPLIELRDRVAEEVRRRESPDALVPIDRDPVPPQFTEGVRRYYERLGSGQ